VESAPPLARLDANPAFAPSARLSTTQGPLAPWQGVTLIRHAQSRHAGAGAAVKTLRLMASLGMNAPARRRRADAPVSIHAFAFGQLFDMVAR